MATTTTNFGFDIPTSSDLVKNGATAIGDLGQDIDTFLDGSPTRVAGKNRIINGSLNIWQRGTTFTGVFAGTYTADRWVTQVQTIAATVTRETDTPNDDFNYSLKVAPASNGTPSTQFAIRQNIEQLNISDFAGKKVTVSFWLKSTKTSMKIRLSTDGSATGGQDLTHISTITANTWTKISLTFDSFLNVTAWNLATARGGFLDIGYPDSTALTTSDNFFIAGVQLEIGQTATPFSNAGGTIQGELAACQRYYQRFTVSGGGNFFGVGFNESTTSTFIKMPFPVIMRTAPTALEQSGTAGDYSVRFTGTGNTTCSAVPTFSAASTHDCTFIFTVASGLTGGQSVMGRALNSSAFLGWSAEL